MIDFDNIDTIPNSIISLLRKNRNLIRDELMLDTKRVIAGHQWDGGIVTKENYEETCACIKDILCCEKIVGFHCTKLINPNGLYDNGLKKLRPGEYEIWMKQFLKDKLPEKKLIHEIEARFAEYDDNGEYEHRKNMIWFVINKSLVYDSGCKYFFKYFGGEVIRRVAYPLKEVVFPILIENGVPTVVAFEFGFNELPDYQQYNLVNALIESQVFEKSYRYYNEMRAEGYITRDVKPDEIVQIYSDNDIKKLKNAVVTC